MTEIYALTAEEMAEAFNGYVSLFSTDSAVERRIIDLLIANEV